MCYYSVLSLVLSYFLYAGFFPARLLDTKIFLLVWTVCLRGESTLFFLLALGAHNIHGRGLGLRLDIANLVMKDEREREAARGGKRTQDSWLGIFLFMVFSGDDKK